jgi:membrane associated rhomboid family serine protease
MFPLRDTVPSRSAPVMTWLLIGVNVAAFLYQLVLPPESLEAMVYRFAMVPAEISSTDWSMPLGVPLHLLPFLTSMFLHGGLLHIVANLWTLWIFGDNVEDRMGPLRFLVFYLLCGLFAGFVHWITNPSSAVPTVGASGAIAGVLGAYLLLYPRARVVTAVPIVFYPIVFELPAVIYLGLWFLLQIWSGFTSMANPTDAGGVAWWAHIGGFVAGMALLAVFKRRGSPSRAPGLARPARHYVYGHPHPRRYYRL